MSSDAGVRKKEVDVVAGSVDEFEPGVMQVIEVADPGVDDRHTSIGVLLDQAGKWHAVRNFCPHMGGQIAKGAVRGTMLPSEPGEYHYDDQEVLVCPWHQYEFSLESGKCLYSAPMRLRKYDIYLQGHNVTVRLPAARG